MYSIKTKQIGFLFLCLLFTLSGCSSPSEKVPPFTWQQFNGRDECIGFGQTMRRPVYQAKVPVSWRRINPSSENSLVDTTLPIISFQLEENLTVYVHTFPTDSLEERIPPEMQVERWKNQIHAPLSINQSFGLSSSDSEEFTQQSLGFSGEMNGQRPLTRPKISRGASKLPGDEGEKPKTQVIIQKVGQSGFCGLYFEGSQGTNTLCGWCLQLDIEHYQTLRFLASTVEEEEHYKQMSADYTIKIVGPTAQIDKHRAELALFAQSFELIQEIPQNL